MVLEISHVQAAIEEDRRRAKRQEVSPTLVQLLRDPAAGPALPVELEATDHRGSLAPVYGIALGVGLSIPIWMVIAWGAYALFD